MTLLERWDKRFEYGTEFIPESEIRRALAIAQAVEEVLTDWTAAAVQRRADELLEGK